MAQQLVATVREIWRYPVKSMLGERLEAAEISPRGLYGDRAWALRDTASGRLISAKKWPRMLQLRATYEIAPAAPDDPGTVRIEFPDGRSVHAGEAAGRPLSEFLGIAVGLDRPQPDRRAEIEIDPATVFGDIPPSELIRGLTPGTALPPTFGAAHGTFFDSNPIHLIASSTLDYLRVLQGGAAAPDVRRFRPNLLIETATQRDGFAEDQWLAGVLAVGGVRFEKLKPSLRCVMTTLPQQELPHDPAILRTAARHHSALVGVTARITGSGAIRGGDPLYLLTCAGADRRVMAIGANSKKRIFARG